MCIFTIILSIYPDNHASAAVAAAEDAKNIEEEVNEVEIEVERSDRSQFVGHGGVEIGACESLHLLGVPGGETGEDQHSDNRDNPLECGIGKENIDYARDDQADKGHEQEAAYLRKISLCEISIDRHRAERTGSDEECIDNRTHSVYEENRGKRDSHQGGEHHKTCEHGPGRHLSGFAREHPCHHKHRDERNPHHERVAVEHLQQ